jgi:hypothetical protein
MAEILDFLKRVHAEIAHFRDGLAARGSPRDLYIIDLVGRAFDALYSLQPHRMPKSNLMLHEAHLRELAVALIDCYNGHQHEDWSEKMTERVRAIATLLRNAHFFTFETWFANTGLADEQVDMIIDRQYGAFENADEFWLVNNPPARTRVLDGLTSLILSEIGESQHVALACGGLSGVPLAYPIAANLRARGVKSTVHLINDMIAAQGEPRPPVTLDTVAFIDFSVRSGITASFAQAVLNVCKFFVCSVLDLPDFRRENPLPFPTRVLFRRPTETIRYNPRQVPTPDSRRWTQPDPEAISQIARITQEFFPDRD